MALATAEQAPVLAMPLSIPAAAVLASLARSVGLVALLAPIAVAAARSSLAGRDPAVGLTAALAVGASTLVIVGVVLSSFSGVTLTGWLVGLAIVDLLVIGHALRRAGRGLRRPHIRLRFPRPVPTLLGTAALAVVVGSVLMSVASARRQERRSHFTQLWMIASTLGGQPAAKVGVANMESVTASYRIVLRTGGRVLFSAPLRLATSRSWTTEVTLSATPHRELVTATLYRAADASPYRVTYLWTPAP